MKKQIKENIKTVLRTLTIPVTAMTILVYMGLEQDKLQQETVPTLNAEVYNSSKTQIETANIYAQTVILNTTADNINSQDTKKEIKVTTTTDTYKTNSIQTATKQTIIPQYINNSEFTTDAQITPYVLGNTLPQLNSTETITVDNNLLEYLYELSEEFNVPYEFILAVCYVESNFISDINNAGLNTDGTVDYGLMGLNGYYLQANCDLYNNGDRINPYDPYENAYIGVQILSTNLSSFNGDIYESANAYNLGAYGWKEIKSSGKAWYYGEKVLDYIETLNNYIS